MMNLKSTSIFTSAGILSAIGASLCCITPVIALLAGSTSLAANFSWIAPARPYLIGLSIVVLVFAWYLTLTTAKTNNVDCHCDSPRKTSFLQSKTFLSIVTVFAILMTSFPLYAKLFYPNSKVQAINPTTVDKTQEVKFVVQGMTCEGCELQVNNELTKVKGILNYKTSYANKSSLVTFDKTMTDVKTIKAAIIKTGYKVNGYTLVNEQP